MKNDTQYRHNLKQMYKCYIYDKQVQLVDNIIKVFYIIYIYFPSSLRRVLKSSTTIMNLFISSFSFISFSLMYIEAHVRSIHMQNPVFLRGLTFYHYILSLFILNNVPPSLDYYLHGLSFSICFVFYPGYTRSWQTMGQSTQLVFKIDKLLARLTNKVRQ